MVRYKKLTVFCLVAVLMLGMIGISQARESSKAGKGDAEGRREMAREMVHNMSIVTMVDKLDLTEEQMVKFLPRWNEHKDLKEKYSLERKKLVNEIRELLKEEKVSQRSLEKALDKLDALKEENKKARQKYQDEINNILTVEQRAKLVVLPGEMKKDVHRLRNVKQKQQKRKEHKMGIPEEQEK